MKGLVLTGLEGSNPLGFLAALGVLNIVSERAERGSDPARLAWRDEGMWRPTLWSSVSDIQELVGVLRSDLDTWRNEPVLQLRYEKKGGRAWDLKPPPHAFSTFLRQIIDSGDRRAIDFASAFAAEGALDNNGATKPTALHFTAGQQQFLEMIDLLVGGVTDSDLEVALAGPWRYDRDLRALLNWDCTVSRDYALRATDPAKLKLGNPGADWLGFRGLSFVRVFASRGRLLTTGCVGEWKTGRFRWPLWSHPLERETVRTLLTLDGVPERERGLRGVPAVFESVIRRSDQGGYGSFAPSAAV